MSESNPAVHFWLTKLLVLTIGVASGFFPNAARTQSSEIDEILVLEKRIEETIPLDLSRYGSRLEVITAEQIEKHGFTDIGQSLQRLIPGLFIAPKNGPFDYFSGSLQGSRSQDILWLIDGVRIANRLYNFTIPRYLCTSNKTRNILLFYSRASRMP